MEALIAKMNELLATTFALYLKGHNFHWNVRGKDFSQFHSFFGDFYEELFEAVDTTAEQIRALNVAAPGGLKEFTVLSRISDAASGFTDIESMVRELYADNQTIIGLLNEAHKLASDQNLYGLVGNFIEARIDRHQKHAWMLRSSMNVMTINNPVKEQVEMAAPPSEDVKIYLLNTNQSPNK
jgi:starvation-inducible DNA-binding protein